MDSYELFDSYDGSMKCLIGREPAEILRYGSGLADLQVEGPEPAALPATDRNVDAGYRILHEGRPLVAHVEFHRRKSSQAELATDIAEAQLRFHRRQNLPVVSLPGTSTAASGARYSSCAPMTSRGTAGRSRAGVSTAGSTSGR